MAWPGGRAYLGPLGYYKYFGFLLENLGVENAADVAPALPIGISFFTFQALSYLIDLSGRRIAVQRDPFRLALYISMFPQLIAGPIVRYSEVETALTERKTTRSDTAIGFERFVLGLSKKTLIADPLGLVADQIFAIPAGGLSPETAWLGALAYSLQLFFDFSAYSDMAIGLGRVMGFRFPENFNYPYISRSITEFWRRWHMTLSRWFRDYVYIPLGGKRHGSGRTYLNLSIVFVLTGFWHGAAWNFVFWGAYHGAFLVLERLGLGRILSRLPVALRHVYLLLVVILGWIPFRADGMQQTLDFWGAMLLGQRGSQADIFPLDRFFDAYIAVILGLAMLFCIPVGHWLRWHLVERLPARAAGAVLSAGMLTLFAVAVVSAGAASYSPFIYFRF